MNTVLLEWIGYFASVVIALSMTMNSIVKFRWINLVGATTFSLYGFLIGAYPVMFLNGIIVGVDLYYLYRIYNKSQLFDILEVKGDNKYLLKFLDFHSSEIGKFFPGFEYKPELNTMSFFVLRNMAVAGVFLAHKEDGGVLKVGLDYVIPEYRDYKNGKYLYYHLNDSFKQNGIKKIITKGGSPKHTSYLKKLGFKENSQALFEKSL